MHRPIIRICMSDIVRAFNEETPSDYQNGESERIGAWLQRDGILNHVRTMSSNNLTHSFWRQRVVQLVKLLQRSFNIL